MTTQKTETQETVGHAVLVTLTKNFKKGEENTKRTFYTKFAETVRDERVERSLAQLSLVAGGYTEGSAKVTLTRIWKFVDNPEKLAEVKAGKLTVAKALGQMAERTESKEKPLSESMPGKCFELAKFAVGRQCSHTDWTRYCENAFKAATKAYTDAQEAKKAKHDAEEAKKKNQAKPSIVD